ncbi:MAG TPA: c-type cytochrome [Gemmatimonadales bacterium]|nr:c-type cytochrome [Gemmatimonadales bacterium]
MTASWWRLMMLGTAACSSGGDGASRAQVLATSGGDPARGEAAIARYGCGSCHVIPGIRLARGKVGPPLSDFAARSYIAGNAPNTPGNLAAWIRRPDSVEPGTVMPTLGVSRQEARDITAYLYLETATGGLGPPRLFPASVLRRE